MTLRSRAGHVAQSLLRETRRSRDLSPALTVLLLFAWCRIPRCRTAGSHRHPQWPTRSANTAPPLPEPPAGDGARNNRPGARRQLPARCRWRCWRYPRHRPGRVADPSGAERKTRNRRGPGPVRAGARLVLTGTITRAGRLCSDSGPCRLDPRARSLLSASTLQPGNQIQVNLADGVIATFKVTSVVEYQKTAFPDQKVYGSNGSSAIHW